MEPIERPGILNQMRPFRFERLPDRLRLVFRMCVRAGMCDTLIQKPGIHFGKVLEPQPLLEQPLAHHANLVLDLTLLPA